MFGGGVRGGVRDDADHHLHHHHPPVVVKVSPLFVLVFVVVSVAVKLVLGWDFIAVVFGVVSGMEGWSSVVFAVLFGGVFGMVVRTAKIWRKSGWYGGNCEEDEGCS